MSESENRIVEKLHPLPEFWIANTKVRIAELKRVWDKFTWDEHRIMYPYFERRMKELEDELRRNEQEFHDKKGE